MDFNLKTYLDVRPISKMQYANILVCFLLNVLDGMDVLIISYTAPVIAKSWSVGSEALGIVFSAGLVGMTIGALFIAPFADKIGRKKIMLISAMIMCISIFLTAYSPNLTVLLILRFISGAGIGCMLANTAVMIAEYTPNKSKDFWVSAGLSGYPIGAVLTGLVAAQIIPIYGWQAMFQIAGIVTLFAIPIIYFVLNESLDFYLKSQPEGALEKANLLLKKLDIPSLQSLPAKSKVHSKLPIDELLKGTYRIPTLQIWTALFFAFATLYFLTSWIPKLAANTGVSVKAAIYAGTLFNLGAVFGIWIQGYFSSKYSLKFSVGSFLIFTGLLMASFKFFSGDIVLLIYTLLGFGVQGGFVGLYAAAARLYPTEIRSTGVGWSIGMGRLGGIIGPIVGGVLIGAGLSMTANFLIFSIPTIIAGIMTMLISSKNLE